MQIQDDENILKWESAYRKRLHELRDEFELRLPLAQEVRNRAETILRRNILEFGIRCEVSSRLKDLNSFRLKFRSKFGGHLRQYRDAVHKNERSEGIASKINALLDDPFTEITDIIGIRCVGLFTRELYPFYRETSTNHFHGSNEYFILKEIITRRFDDAGKRGSKLGPTAEDNLSSLSGCSSVQYDLRLRADSIVTLFEADLLRIPFELQLRSYAQHMFDDVNHFLSRKSDDILYPAEKFEQKTVRLQNALTNIQIEIDKLFEESRMIYKSILRDIQNGVNIERLLDLRVTPDTLRLYAIYVFIASPPEGLDLPKHVEDAKFVDLWLRELSDGLNNLGYTKVRSIDELTRKGIEFVVHYSQQQSTSKRPIFKKHDLTDILSKCLLFSITELRNIYPILSTTRENIERFLNDNPGANQ